MSIKSQVTWVPDCGDIVWLEFDPYAGREQAVHRPAVVLGPASYNAKAGMTLCCPMTTKIKGYLFEVAVVVKPASVVLSGQVRSLDWRVRNAKLKGKVSAKELEAVRQRARLLVG
ncbi:endoribonuclease MazF [Gluconacetobacter entanii]|uniref:endoribonuclease MazF n=1 Tax=Gluconacetobacter entanii TaxID=108528 RepID=UPI001C934D99|nr:endoribonuclease MazF [Gluconacetobacter entanii]MBY4639736.1 endoribonuclease MazF [Gluconacetobacter entanii]MCW4580371.1 endoribonuclease MazF [Gluconacetobacter entanii]MCW4583700.1 endoribonuclease MazF [Gluconacetobacter entanii]MCW4587020.1 endoribonuclease MazF [Gluconacetobacter entanii]